MKKRILSLALALSFVLALVPVSVMAQTAYTVTVQNSRASATGAGSYAPGATVTISASTSAGLIFRGWTVNSGSVTLADASSATTTFTMPANDVRVTANWSLPLVVENITIEVPGIPDMTIEILYPYDHYFYRESDGAVMFAFAYGAMGQFLDGAPVTWEELDELDDWENIRAQGRFMQSNLIINRDLTLSAFTYKLTEEFTFDDIDVKAGIPVDGAINFTWTEGESSGGTVGGSLSHYFTIDGVTVYFLQAVGQMPFPFFLDGVDGWDGWNGLIEEWTDMGFVMRPISSIAVGGSPPPPEAPNVSAASSWAREYINTAFGNGIIPASLQNNYRNNITRAEFCALAVALIETVTGRAITERQVFADDEGDTNIRKIGGLGIVTGTGTNAAGERLFSPGDPIQRQQAALILTRAAGHLGKPLPNQAPAFSDNDRITSWAVEPIGQMQATGIMTGSGGRFDPRGTYTREQSIITMVRMWNWVKG
jgi:uncharacterized repeat protein (TIGR02543 family)